MNEEDFLVTIPPYVTPGKRLSVNLKKLSHEEKKKIPHFNHNPYQKLNLLLLKSTIRTMSSRDLTKDSPKKAEQGIINVLYKENTFAIKILSWATTHRHLLRLLRDCFGFPRANNLLLVNDNETLTYEQSLPTILSTTETYFYRLEEVTPYTINSVLEERFKIEINIPLQIYSRGCRIYWDAKPYKLISEIISDILEALDKNEYHNYTTEHVALVYQKEILDPNKFLGEYRQLGSAMAITTKDLSKEKTLEMSLMRNGYDDNTIIYKIEDRKNKDKEPVLSLIKQKERTVLTERICGICSYPLADYFVILPKCRHCCDLECLKLIYEEQKKYQCPICLLKL